MARLVARLGITRYEADEYYRIALDFYNKRNLEEALNNLNSAIELNPHRPEYYATRGFFRLEDGLPADKTEPDFDEALKRNPYEMLANYCKGIINYRAENYEAAREYFNTAWAVMPERVETLYYLGLVEHRLMNNRQALAWMQQAAAALEGTEDRALKRYKRNADKWVAAIEKQLERQIKLEEKQAATPPPPPE